MELRGIFPPITTPFDALGTVALDPLRENIRKYNQTGLAGYVVVGSTGESVYLREDEKLLVWETVREAAAPEKMLIAGTGLESTAETIALTRRAASLGYQVAMVKTPHYFKPQMTEAALEEHFRRVADASPIPILIYSVPQFTGLVVEAGLVARLSEHPNIIGIKESSGNVERVTRMVGESRAGFQVLVGSAPTLYPSLAIGAAGAVLAAACALPQLCVAIYEAFQRGNHESARRLQHELIGPALAVTAKHGIAGLKYAMDLIGYYGGPVRAPLLPVSAEAQTELRTMFAPLTAWAMASG